MMPATHTQAPSESRLLSPFFSFFIVVGAQIGVGVLGFERIIATFSGQDAWLSVVLAGMTVHVLVWLLYGILKRGEGDLVAIHKAVLGKAVGGLLNLYFIGYFALLAYTVIRTYIEIIQMWMFVEVYVWVLFLLLVCLAYSYVTNGLRVVVGLCVIGLFVSAPLLLANYFGFTHANVSNLFPMFEHSPQAILLGSKAMTLNMLGFEVLLVAYPFLKNGPASQKWSHLAVFTTTLIYTLAIVLTTIYFNQNQLNQTIWATITLWKVVDLSVIERFEYIGISTWLFVVLPTICLLLWAASRIANQAFFIKQRTGLRLLIALLFVCSFFVVGRKEVNQLNDVTAEIGFWTIITYIPFLYIAQKVKLAVIKGENKR
ncbi:GerAB/ArcD/ProY family transporter [Shouchella clausii]|uniref:GerAB/ArcD/ProY family transporter n=1 Tax=Shouchella clausii TaxID=79880 RepID=UPI000B968024|nr:GerAB/ArcD/ProY family transporter [Shouchella clausii]AST97768.1 hypothetical protein BC8716_18120 [Shouchella clausii]MCR1289827.1 spore germination protein [Shouchella clausii]MEB5474223.1 GerAB/ArcD/ProY family transporter [Shouchella clausii]QNM44207.1 spore gernimation protein GerB [Shouchella clausii]WQG97104.1 GerAB/ArcD/ProY family transporter [Shouchella clausii]